MHPKNSELLYCGVGGNDGGNLFKSTNGGISWFIPYQDSIFRNGVVVIEFDHYDASTLYVGRSWDGKLSRSNDGGVNWEYAGYTNGGSITALEFGRNSDEMYVASWWSFDYPVGIFKTTDRGITWRNLWEEFEGLANVYDVKVNSNTSENVYVGLDAGYDHVGVYVKKDNQPWEYDGLTGLIINSIAIINNSIYAATNEGLYFRELVTNIDKDEISLYETVYLLFPAYPNPFNPSTTIIYQNPELSFVTLKVYDVLGNEIATIVNEEKPAGSYEVEFDATYLTSGIYFYRLKAGDYVETKKMVLLK